jgi:hypothetical protein
MRKICAKLTNGVRMGVGFAFERACEPGHCDKCTGDEFHRRCRLYTFSPHYKVFLRSAQGASSQSGQVSNFVLWRSTFLILYTVSPRTRMPVLDPTSSIYPFPSPLLRELEPNAEAKPPTWGTIVSISLHWLLLTSGRGGLSSIQRSLLPSVEDLFSQTCGLRPKSSVAILLRSNTDFRWLHCSFAMFIIKIQLQVGRTVPPDA